MDLSGRGPAYRGSVAPCPECDRPMREERTPSAEIDVCDECGGVWLDWFDGEPHAVAAEVEERRRGTPIPPMTARVRRCPRCTRTLDADVLPWLDAREGELDAGVEVFRCGECAGIFLPRSSTHLLHARTTEVQPLTGWAAFVEVLRRIFGLKETRL